MIQHLRSIVLIVAILATGSMLSAKETYIVLEKHSRKVLLASGSEYKMALGGSVQLAAAKVALDWRKLAGVSSASMVHVPAAAVHLGGSNPLRLQAGDKMQLRDFLYACILSEDAVASRALAYHVGAGLLQKRGQVGDPMGAFVAEMNRLAGVLGMTKTKFLAPDNRAIGRSVSMTTASDMARLAIKLAGDTGFRFYAKQGSRTVTVYKAGGASQRYVVKNQNSLLGAMVTGLNMTRGYQQNALILADKRPYIKKNVDGTEEVTPVQLLSVVLGSVNSKAVSEQLIPQGWSAYEAWRRSGYLAYPDKRGFIKMPK